jgi:hypothetical protein
MVANPQPGHAGVPTQGVPRGVLVGYQSNLINRALRAGVPHGEVLSDPQESGAA